MPLAVNRTTKPPQGRAAWRDRIRQAGLRSTAPRVLVLEQLQAAVRPMSHGELADALEPEGLNRVTVFRNLNDLTEAGLVERTDLGDHTWRFELKREGDSKNHESTHPHFSCTDCGAVSCLPEESVALKSGRGVPRSVSRRNIRVTLQGLCDACD
ncbi:MAG: transcriptional repressor [Myxococcaceae bacterium]|nr:transcriptional repressor [Myxococcaceae bacterium]